MKNANPSALRLTHLNVPQTDILSKSFVYYFLLLGILFLYACIDGPLNEAQPERVGEEERIYTEYEGTALAYDDEGEIGLIEGDVDQPEKSEFIGMRWEIGKEIVFLSRKYEFDISESEIIGAGLCCELAEPAKEQTAVGDWMELRFEPREVFWNCLDSNNYFIEEEVFYFLLFVRERS